MLFPRTAAAATAMTLLILVYGSVGASTTEAYAPQRAASPFVVGEVFPDLAFPSLGDGRAMRLSDFRGSRVMLHVFASW